MDEMDVEIINVRLEMVKGIEILFTFPPVVLVRPIICDFSYICERNTLAPIIYAFFFGPSCVVNSVP